MINTKRLIVNPSWCKGCGICVAFCPKGVLELQNGHVAVKNQEACVLCGQCESRCPDYAVYIEEEEAENLWVKLC